MSEEDTNLSLSLHKLKIISRSKPSKADCDDELPIHFNPFAKRTRTKTLSQSSLFGLPCICKKRRVYKNPSLKKFSYSTKNKLLREPIIVLLDKCNHERSELLKCKQNECNGEIPAKSSQQKKELFGECATFQDFRSIIDGCEQLSLSNDIELQTFPSQSFREVQQATAARFENIELSSSCSQQAMARLCLNPPCDVTIDELACYFETFVHIPKKMSSMAEMMYI